MADRTPSRTVGRIVTVVGVQAGWFACVLGAAGGYPLLGPAVVALLLVGHAAISRDGQSASRRARAGYLGTLGLSAAAIGVVMDGGLALAGVLAFPPSAALGWPVPVWMLALWVNLVPAVDDLAALLGPRMETAAAVGAVAGPLAYLAGSGLGAMVLLPSTPVALALISLEWAIALPLLIRLRPESVDRS